MDRFGQSVGLNPLFNLGILQLLRSYSYKYFRSVKNRTRSNTNNIYFITIEFTHYKNIALKLDYNYFYINYFIFL